MTFNPLKEKGTPLGKQLRSWHDIARRPFNKNDVDCYSRTRQILMNGIEIESWNFKHQLARCTNNEELKSFLAETKRIEDMQQTTINWLAPSDQSVLETTLGYEQVAVDLTAWLAQNETDSYVKETFNFGLLEDFDHLYRYSQWAYLEHGINPNDIVQAQTDVLLGRPTQQHHNDNKLRLRHAYDKNTATPQTKVNILTLVSAEQQTHNYYAEHGYEYGSEALRETYAEIKDVEEEHVTMYESLIDATETPFEKLLLHEFTEVCTYYNCMQDEPDLLIKSIWEEFLSYELEHLHIAGDLLKKYENRSPEEIIGDKIVLPCRFKSQKDYVSLVLKREINKRLGNYKDYAKIDSLTESWSSYDVQEAVNSDGSPTERTIKIIGVAEGCDIVSADKKLISSEPELLERGLDTEVLAPDTVMPNELMNLRHFDLFEE